MKRLMFTVAMSLVIVACNNITSSETKEWEDKAKDFASDVAQKSVELYEESAPVVEEAAYDVAQKSVELYEEAAPVVEEAVSDAADKSAEMYNGLKD